MRRSMSRHRRAKTEVESVSSVDKMPRLLADDLQASTSSLPSTSPMSQAARRNLRAQLFGMDFDSQSTEGTCPIQPRHSYDPMTTSDDIAGQAFDVQAAVAMLHEMRKTATTDELTALQRAPRTETNDKRQEVLFMSDDSQRTLSRRKSLFKPGEATRPKTSSSTRREPQTKDFYESQTSTPSQKTSLDVPTRPSVERPVTPGDLERAYLGIHSIGSLRITNIITPSPSPRPLEAAVVVVSPLEPAQDYFSVDDQFHSSTSSHNTHHNNPIDTTLSSTQSPAFDQASHQDEDDLVMSEDAFESLLQTSPTIKLETKRRDRSSTVLVGHRRFARERGNTVGLTFESESATLPESGPALETRKGHLGAVPTLLVFTEHALHAKDQAQRQHGQRDRFNDVNGMSSNASDHTPSVNDSPKPTSVKPSRNTRPPLELKDSACHSRTSLESSLRSASPDKIWQFETDVQRADSLDSVYTLYDNTSSETVKHHQEEDEVHFGLDTSNQDSFNTSSVASSIYAPSRTPEYDCTTTQCLQDISSPSSHTSSIHPTSPRQPRKLQKKRPYSQKLEENIIVQGRLLNNMRNLPELPQDMVVAHALRLDNNPGMDHLLETYSRVSKSSSSHDNSCNTDGSLQQTQEIRFPSPTPTEEVDARYLSSPPRGRHTHTSSVSSPTSPNRSRNVFRSLSRSRRKSLALRKTSSPSSRNEVLITVADLGDVVGVLGASPYDIAARSRPSSSGTSTRKGEEGGKQVIQPCQIGYMDRSDARKERKSMSAEEATASAMKRSRDRIVDADGNKLGNSSSSSPVTHVHVGHGHGASGRGRDRHATPPPPVPQMPLQALSVQSTSGYTTDNTITASEDEPEAATSYTQVHDQPLPTAAPSSHPPLTTRETTTSISTSPLLTTPSQPLLPPPPPPPPTAWSTSLTNLHNRTRSTNLASSYPTPVPSSSSPSLIISTTTTPMTQTTQSTSSRSPPLLSSTSPHQIRVPIYAPITHRFNKQDVRPALQDTTYLKSCATTYTEFGIN